MVVTVPGVCAFLMAERVREVALHFGVRVAPQETWLAPRRLEERGVSVHGDREVLIARILRCDEPVGAPGV